MLAFLLRRALGLVFVLFGVLTLTFIVGHLAPGDPVLTIMGQRHDPALYHRLRHVYGLDQPLWQQYLAYIGGVLHGNFGISYHYTDTPVSTLLLRDTPATLQLGIPALLLGPLLGVPLGILAATRQGKPAYTVSTGLALLLYSIPTFVLAPLLLAIDISLYNSGYPSLPVAGWGTLSEAVLPILVLAAPNVAYLARLTRTSLLGVLHEDYIRTARAKGLKGRIIIGRHALRLALLPVVTFLGPSLALIITGTFVVENIFNIPGIGFAVVNSIFTRDYPLMQALAIVLAASVVIMNTLTDVIYSMLDPRIELAA
ncbi:MAG TPA: ABC transporter permease [Chloroflexota bacterium]|nr:ABC transporter permease [Chloroflexota bacterium]